MTRLISPAPNGWDSLRFGATSPAPYSPSRPHRGKDWGWYYRDPVGSRRVVASASGTVISVTRDGSWNFGWGNRVVIRITPEITVALNHLATGTIAVREGQWVNAGDYLAQMGDTGETYGQPHLHEELYINGVRVDPDYYRNHDLPGTGSGAGEIDEWETFLMNNQQKLDMIFNALFQPVDAAGNGYYKTDAIINEIREVQKGNIRYPNEPYNAFVALANAIREDDTPPPKK